MLQSYDNLHTLPSDLLNLRTRQIEMPLMGHPANDYQVTQQLSLELGQRAMTQGALYLPLASNNEGVGLPPATLLSQIDKYRLKEFPESQLSIEYTSMRQNERRGKKS